MQKALTLKQPPLADGLPLLGSLLPLLQDAENFFRSQYHKHGPCYRVQVLGNGFVVMGGPAAVEAMNKNSGQFDAWKVWEKVIQEFGGRHVLSMFEGERHLRYRAAARKGFAKSRVLENIPTVVGLTQEALNDQTAGQPFQLLGFVQRLIANCVGTLSLGRKPGPYLADFIVWWHTQLAVNFSGTKPPKFLRRPEYLRATANLKALAQEIVQANDAPSPYVNDLKQLMHTDPDLINEQELLFMMLLPYVAGLDTVVNVVSLTLYRLLRDPALLEQVRAEATPLWEAGMPLERMSELKWLHATVLETMRHHTIANLPNRYATQDFLFEGFQIRSGQKLMLHMNAAAKDPKLFRDPERFDPSRFLPPRNEHRQPGAMSPYGSGAHTCLGAGMAEALMGIVIAGLANSSLELYPVNYSMKPFQASNLLFDPKVRCIKR